MHLGLWFKIAWRLGCFRQALVVLLNANKGDLFIMSLWQIVRISFSLRMYIDLSMMYLIPNIYQNLIKFSMLR